MLVKNISEGPRGIHVLNEVVMLAPGESRDLDIVAEGKDDRNKLDAANLAVAKRSGWFEFGGKADAAAKLDLDTMSEADLRAFIKDKLGKDADAKADKAALLAQARTLAAG